MSSELRVDKIVPTAGVPTGGGGGIIQVVSNMQACLLYTSDAADE